MDRDENAARNILNRGLEELYSSVSKDKNCRSRSRPNSIIYACGDHVRPSSKEEGNSLRSRKCSFIFWKGCSIKIFDLVGVVHYESQAYF
jgi:hypothetical protein